MSKFFIDRPIFAWVIALVIMLVGALSILKLPINQYPSIAPPAIAIAVTYPGASAQTVQDTVVQVIEQQLNGIDNLRYVSSESNSDGSMTITATFEQGTNPDTAQVQVQNKLNLATPLLPQEVQQQGIRVTKAVKNFLLVIGLVSEDGSMTKDDLANYIVSNMQDPISRTAGVGDFQVFGAQYAMRIWLDPAKLNKFQLTPVDVKTAVAAQNVQVSSGQLGGLPALPGTQLNATIIGKTRLQTAEQFESILLKVNKDGSQVRLGDVAQVGLGGENYAVSAQFNGKPASGLAVKLATGANALDTAKALRETIKGLEPFFPPGVKAVFPYDTTPVVTESISGVIHTLIEAVVLVFLVMYLFLQNFRATIITTMTVPVVLLGTFGILAAAGFSINTLTMFAMVLAIGLLVDDAIVVVENVERVMSEEGLPPKEATKRSMEQIQGALVGIALVLSAVLLPMAFFGGSTGVIYRQFSITIVSAMGLSVLVALIFTPALCATMLKPLKKGEHHTAKGGFFGWFNRNFDRSVNGYERSVGTILRNKVPFLLGYALIVVGMIWLFARIPTAFLPEEDQGVLFAQVQTPAGSSAERTQVVVDQMREYLLKDEADTVSSVFTVNGFNFAGRGQSSGMAFIMLKPWDERSKENSVFALAQRAQQHFFTFRDAMVFAFAPPAVLELGNATGFDVFLQDRGGVGHAKLMEARNQFLAKAAQSKILSAVRPNGLNDEPQYQLTIDDERASALGVTIADINNTLSIALGASYVNDFIDRGRVKKVYIQGEPSARMSPEDLQKWYVRNGAGEMVPFSSFAKGEWTYGSPKLSRYNGVEAMEILGAPAPGYSTGEAMAEVERIAGELPSGIGFSWTGMSYEEKLSGSQMPALFALSVLFVFLCLAALYESWSIPIAVVLVVPLGIIGALIATSLRGLSNDVYFLVGLLTTIGLAAKNAILIVEFAKELHEQGRSLYDAAIEACRMRLRPIIMTSLAFILGVVPLTIASGAGAGSQHAIGTGVIGGMISATVLAIFWVESLGKFFEGPYVLFWIEVLSILGMLRIGVPSLRKVSSTLAEDADLNLLERIQDVCRCMNFFRIPISVSTPHTYISTRPFLPSESPLSLIFSMHFTKGIKVLRGKLSSWPAPPLLWIGHGGAVTCTDYSPNGCYIVTGSKDQTVRIWDAETGDSVSNPLEGHCGYVLSVAYSPNGQHIVSGSSDGTVRIWSAESGTSVGKPLEGHANWVRSVAYSPDGQYIISGSDDQTIRLWNAETGSAIGEPLKGHTGWVLSVAYSPDGQHITSGSNDKTIRIWNAVTGSALSEPLKGHTGPVLSVAYSLNGQHIISGSSDTTIRIWNAETGSPVGKPLEGHTGEVLSVACSPDEWHIISGSSDRTIRIWNAKICSEVGKPLEGHADSVFAVAYSPDGRDIISASGDSTVRIWDAETGSATGKPSEGHAGSVWSVAYSPDGQRIISGSNDKTIRIWSAETGSAVGKPLVGHTDRVWSVAYSPDGQHIASGSDDRTIRIWNSETGSAVGRPLEGHSSWVRSVAYSPDGRQIISGSDDNTIRMWNAETGSAVGGPLEGHTDWVRSVAYSPDGRQIISGSDDKTVRIWNAETWSAVCGPLEGHTDFVRSVAYSPDGRHIVSGSNDKTIRIWNAETGSAVGKYLEGHTDTVLSVAYSPDGRYIISGSSDKTIRIWDAETGDVVGNPLEGHAAAVSSVAYSPDGRYITSGSSDRAIHVWDSFSHNPIQHPSDLQTGRPDLEGWVRDSAGGLLYWVPHDCRMGFHSPALLTITPKSPVRSVSLQFDNVAFGTSWTQIFDTEQP